MWAEVIFSNGGNQKSDGSCALIWHFVGWFDCLRTHGNVLQDQVFRIHIFNHLTKASWGWIGRWGRLESLSVLWRHEKTSFCCHLLHRKSKDHLYGWAYHGDGSSISATGVELDSAYQEEPSCDSDDSLDGGSRCPEWLNRCHLRWQIQMHRNFALFEKHVWGWIQTEYHLRPWKVRIGHY